MAKTLEQLQNEYIELTVRDTKETPAAYKESVRNFPEEHARRVIAGLSRDEVAQMLRDFKAERRACGLR